MTPVPDQLRAVVAKLTRAQQHIQALDGQITLYLESCRDAISTPVKINTGKNIIRLTFAPLPDPELLVSMIIGDSIHNMRSALDHLWKRLNGTGNFPIYGDIDGPNNWNANKTKRLVGVDIGAHAIIDQLQPCHHGKDAPLHPLSVLNMLSNLDKHEAIHLTKPHSVNMQFVFSHKGSSRPAYILRPPAVFHDKAEVVITDVPNGAVEPGMDVNVKGTLFVALKDRPEWATRPIQELLNHLIDAIRRGVVGPLAPFTK